ncbi:serine recombinase [Sorangium cellulosum]|uniref:Serine recombinase n=1 Tax=Sorangium cellulosum TaxID=56 RepID=A0A2L0F6T2_SORCE|nr:recombinase family protein [Sorangium cellulosum]AUX47304.1 serine recombinase [Sorangium cellulosum]
MNAGAGERRAGAAVASSKIGPRHVERLAIVYVRQSHPSQIVHHPESARVQYDLAEHAVALGWSRERVLVIDDDQGRTATNAEGRPGFQRLVAEVGLDHVGIIIGFQMSRLARSCRDWHQLIEVCALFGTLLCDLDGVYDPANYNDRLVLGLKGTISEAELHVIKQRMHAGKLAKAQRGELGTLLAFGYVRRPSGEIVKDPDEQVRCVVDLLFEQFKIRGTVQGVLCYLVEHDLKLPLRVASGPDKGQLRWVRPNRTRLQETFKNPIYAGAYAYGRRRVDPRTKRPGRRATGRRIASVNQWTVCLRDRLPAYISWEQYEQNLRQLELNRNVARGVARKGSTFLAGLLRCGRCGHRMVVQYSEGNPRYVCVHDAAVYGAPLCQSIAARAVDRVVEALVLRALEPSALEVSLAVAADMERERVREEQLWQQRLERARYEVQRARRQYDAVEPENRLVARTLERALEELLGAEQTLQEDHRRAQAERPTSLTEADRSAIQALATELPRLWNSPTTTNEQRKEVVRQMLEEACLTVVGNSEQVQMTLRWAGGHETTTTLTRPVGKLSQLSYYDDLVCRAEQLRQEGKTFQGVADALNAEAWRPARRRETFNASMVNSLLASKKGDRDMRTPRPLPEKLKAHEWTLPALADELGMSRITLYSWVLRGKVQARKVQSEHVHGLWILRADEKERERLAALRTARRRRRPQGVQTG